jgi:hypothetical protein
MTRSVAGKTHSFEHVKKLPEELWSSSIPRRERVQGSSLFAIFYPEIKPTQYKAFLSSG